MIFPQRSRRQRGVTLIELLIVIVIVSILASIAIPGYRAYVIRVNRIDGKSRLLSFASRLERCFTRTNNYTISGDAGGAACLALPFTNPEGTYTFTGNIQALAFTLTATPINGQAQDTKCTTLTIDQTGLQGATGTLTPLQCWSGSGG